MFRARLKYLARAGVNSYVNLPRSGNRWSCMGDELIEVCTGAHAAVFLTRAAAKRFRAANVKGRAQVLQRMQEFAEQGSVRLSELQYKFEQRFPVEGKKIPVWAFKGYQLRVYGAPDGQRWIGTVVVEKKTQKADVKALQRAAKVLALHMR